MHYRCVAVAVLLLSLLGAASCPAEAAVQGTQSSCTPANLRQLQLFGVRGTPVRSNSKGNEGTFYFKNFEVDVDDLPNCVVRRIIVIAKVHPFHIRLNNLSPWLASLDVKSDDVPFKGFLATAAARNGRTTGFPYETGTPVVTIDLIEKQNRHVAISNQPYTDAPGMGIARWHGQPFFFAEVWYEPAPHNPPEFWPDCP